MKRFVEHYIIFSKVIMEKVKIGKYNFEGEEWNQVSSEAKVLISKMVNKDQKKRYSAEQAL
jgi:calcium-dependent protein kinase